MVIEKSKKPIGSISHRSDGDYKKIGEGDWKKITEDNNSRSDSKPIHNREYYKSQDDSEYDKDVKEHLDRLSNESIDGLSQYMLNYKLINNFLRDTEKLDSNKAYTPFIESKINLMNKAFAETNINGESAPELYRGGVFPLNIVKNMKVGNVFQDNGYVSTSKDINQAKTFMNDKGIDTKTQANVIFKITPGKFKFIPVSGLSKTFANEKEYLLNKGTQFVIKDVSFGKDKYGGKIYNLTIEPKDNTHAA